MHISDGSKVVWWFFSFFENKNVMGSWLFLIGHAAVGWGLGKKRLSIDSGILGAHADIYKRLMEPKNRGPYFIKLWAQRP